MEIILGIVIGAAVGAVIAWLVMRGQLNVARTVLDERTAEGQALQQTLREREQTLAEQTQARQELAVKAEVLASQLSEQERRHAEAVAAQQARFDETIAKVTAQMKDATGEMLRQRQKEFQETSAGSIGQLVNPLRETIDKMQKAMSETQNRQSADSGALKTIIQQMMQQSEAARKSTDELTRVFRHSNTVQGSWG